MKSTDQSNVQTEKTSIIKFEPRSLELFSPNGEKPNQFFTETQQENSTNEIPYTINDTEPSDRKHERQKSINIKHNFLISSNRNSKQDSNQKIRKKTTVYLDDSKTQRNMSVSFQKHLKKSPNKAKNQIISSFLNKTTENSLPRPIGIYQSPTSDRQSNAFGFMSMASMNRSLAIGNEKVENSQLGKHISTLMKKGMLRSHLGKFDSKLKSLGCDFLQENKSFLNDQNQSSYSINCMQKFENEMESLEARMPNLDLYNKKNSHEKFLEECEKLNKEASSINNFRRSDNILRNLENKVLKPIRLCVRECTTYKILTKDMVYPLKIRIFSVREYLNLFIAACFARIPDLTTHDLMSTTKCLEIPKQKQNLDVDNHVYVTVFSQSEFEGHIGVASKSINISSRLNTEKQAEAPKLYNMYTVVGKQQGEVQEDQIQLDKLMGIKRRQPGDTPPRQRKIMSKTVEADGHFKSQVITVPPGEFHRQQFNNQEKQRNRSQIYEKGYDDCNYLPGENISGVQHTMGEDLKPVSNLLEGKNVIGNPLYIDNDSNSNKKIDFLKQPGCNALAKSLIKFKNDIAKKSTSNISGNEFISAKKKKNFLDKIFSNKGIDMGKEMPQMIENILDNDSEPEDDDENSELYQITSNYNQISNRKNQRRVEISPMIKSFVESINIAKQLDSKSTDINSDSLQFLYKSFPYSRQKILENNNNLIGQIGQNMIDKNSSVIEMNKTINGNYKEYQEQTNTKRNIFNTIKSTIAFQKAKIEKKKKLDTAINKDLVRAKKLNQRMIDIDDILRSWVRKYIVEFYIRQIFFYKVHSKISDILDLNRHKLYKRIMKNFNARRIQNWLRKKIMWKEACNPKSFNYIAIQASLRMYCHHIKHKVTKSNMFKIYYHMPKFIQVLKIKTLIDNYSSGRRCINNKVKRHIRNVRKNSDAFHNEFDRQLQQQLTIEDEAKINKKVDKKHLFDISYHLPSYTRAFKQKIFKIVYNIRQISYLQKHYKANTDLREGKQKLELSNMFGEDVTEEEFSKNKEFLKKTETQKSQPFFQKSEEYKSEQSLLRQSTVKSQNLGGLGIRKSILKQHTQINEKTDLEKNFKLDEIMKFEKTLEFLKNEQLFPIYTESIQRWENGYYKEYFERLSKAKSSDKLSSNKRMVKRNTVVPKNKPIEPLNIERITNNVIDIMFNSNQEKFVLDIPSDLFKVLIQTCLEFLKKFSVDDLPVSIPSSNSDTDSQKSQAPSIDKKKPKNNNKTRKSIAGQNRPSKKKGPSESNSDQFFKEGWKKRLSLSAADLIVESRQNDGSPEKDDDENSPVKSSQHNLKDKSPVSEKKFDDEYYKKLMDLSLKRIDRSETKRISVIPEEAVD